MGVMLARLAGRCHHGGMQDPVRIEMFLDVSCPWCHGALETNRRLLDELYVDATVPPLEVLWRFMRLHPMPREGGLTLVPMALYFNDGKVKLELALARGKRDYDKRADLAKRDADREIQRAYGRAVKGRARELR